MRTRSYLSKPGGTDESEQTHGSEELEYLGRALKEYHVEFCSKTGQAYGWKGQEDRDRLCAISVKRYPVCFRPSGTA